MKQIKLKIFIVSSLFVTEIKDYISSNYPSFSIIYESFEYNKNTDKFRLIVDLKPEPLSSFIVSLRSEWLCSSRFNDEYYNIKRFIANPDVRPF